MVIRIGRNRNTNDVAVTAQVTLNSTTAVVVQAANEKRIFFGVNNNSASDGFWVRLYPAATDNIKQGIFLSGNSQNGPIEWEMPNDNTYTGEISAIADNTGVTAYVTEY